MKLSIEELVEETRSKFNDASIVMKLTEKAIKKIPTWKTQRTGETLL